MRRNILQSTVKKPKDSEPSPFSIFWSKTELQKVSLIIPAYNEEETLPGTLTNMIDTMEWLNRDYELIIVDDGSVDGTHQTAERLEKLNHRIKVVSYTPNKGKGQAIKTGFGHSTGGIVGYIDADLNPTPERISEYLERLEGVDAVVASKRHPDSDIVYPLHRRVLSWGFHRFIRLLFGLTLSDTQCGFKFFKRKVLQDVTPRLLVKRWAFDVELLVLAHRKDYTIAEGPISFIHSEEIICFKDILRMTLDVMSIFYRLHFTGIYD